jgi:uncharacterized protein (DUF1499 family)
VTTLLVAAAVAAAALAGWIRLAPLDPAQWHRDPLAVPDPATPNFARIVPGVIAAPDGGALAARVAAAMAALPRTRLLAESDGGGMTTWVTRSRIMGYPDLTTIRILPAPEGGVTLAALARSRWGRSDLGVNRARLEALAAALAP